MGSNYIANAYWSIIQWESKGPVCTCFSPPSSVKWIGSPRCVYLTTWGTVCVEIVVQDSQKRRRNSSPVSLENIEKSKTTYKYHDHANQTNDSKFLSDF
jgi:hypothetical protein